MSLFSVILQVLGFKFTLTLFLYVWPLYVVVISYVPGTSVISTLAMPSASVIAVVVFPLIVMFTAAPAPTLWPSAVTT